MEPDAVAEKMAALKRAYADVMLNMAEESAARIVASERRALRFQQSLFETKEEALAMFLRFKSLMDSKMKDAENTSLSQFQRIQELEGQLRVAEHTIVCLREDLERAINELMKTKSALAETLNQSNIYGHTTSNNGKCQESLSSRSYLCPLDGPETLPTIDMDTTDMPTDHAQMNIDGDCCSTGNVTEGEFLKDSPPEKVCANNPNPLSITMRNKEPELYGNGCTQRIHAFEHNALNAQASHQQSAIQDPMLELLVPQNGKNERCHDNGSSKLPNIVIEEAKNLTESAEHVQPSNSSGNAAAAAIDSKPRSYPTKSAAFANSPTLDVRCHKPPHIEELRINSGATITMKSISEEPLNKMLKSHCAPMSVTSLGLEGRRLSMNRTFSNENLVLSQCTNRTATSKVIVEQSQLNCQNENGSKDVIPSSMTEKDDGHKNGCKDVISSSTTGTEKSIETKLPEVDASKLAPADQSTENVYSSCMKDALPVIDSNSEVGKDYQSSETLPQAGKEKFLKYTFQRTRKRGSSGSKTESNLTEKITAKRKTTDEEYAPLERQKPMLDNTELPRHSRRLMQVARQLISLSEKRW